MSRDRLPRAIGDRGNDHGMGTAIDDRASPVTTRMQLTLFVPAAAAREIERARAEFNPVQHGLIACHVTLCREDELTDLARICQTLDTQALPAISIDFGPATRFADGAGVLLPAVGGLAAFVALRRAVLRDVVIAPRPHAPHLTVMHPRNATCTDAAFAAIAARLRPSRVTFDVLSLIEQRGDGPWRTLATWPLGPAMP